MAAKQPALDFLTFVNAAPTPFHAVHEAKQLLDKAGFQEIKERDSWASTCQPGGKYYLTRNTTTLVAFAIGKQWQPGNAISMIGAHTDSPVLRVKPVSKKSGEGFVQVGVETYGGGIWHTWFDRDLGVAGRVMTRESDGSIVQKLVKIDRPILRVPTLAIHLDRQENFSFNKETQLFPIAGLIAAELNRNDGADTPDTDKGGELFSPLKSVTERHHSHFVELIANEAGVSPSDILDFEMILFDTQKSCLGGMLEEFIFSPRLDNLNSTFCATVGLIDSVADKSALDDEEAIRLIALFDHEEIGSRTAQGADSNILPSIIRRLSVLPSSSSKSTDLSTAYEQTLSTSFLVSADMAHSVNPNYSGKYESDHKPEMNKGLVIKINANARYATNSPGIVLLEEIARKTTKETGVHVPLQLFVVRNDSSCGSTIGPMLSAALGARTLDLGNPQLSMHSIRETGALREALIEFEGILTEEQRGLYKVSATKPDVASVIAFVTEIDANNSTTRRCVAPRLCTFLEATQQFSDVVGTFISSNPQIAALIWGGVKMAILTASNITSYFDKVTKMIMEIGRSCPTYQQFGQLYPGCISLQRELCEYYAAIVQLCTKIIEVSRRPPITQTLSSIFNPFESDFKSPLDKLKQATKDIQLQISLASKQANEETKKLLENESQNNAASRKLTNKFRKETQKEHTEAHQWRIHMMKREAASLRSSIRQNLSTIDYVKPWKQAIQQRVPSTAEWLLQEFLFHDWQDDQNTAILWCPGTMGMGKTVLISNVVAQLHASRNTNDIISYYICRADNTASLSARNIIGSLARQILDSQIKHAEDESLQRLYEDSNDLNTAEVVDFVLSRLHDDNTYYLAIDGLDECEPVEIRKVAQSMAKLCNMRVKNFKVLCTGRPELENQLFGAMKPKYKIPVTETKVDLEMDRYIAAAIGNCLEDKQLILGDPTLIVKIFETLKKGSNGMFLWTRLFIEELCEQGSDSDILDALKHPPRGLSEIFDRKLSRVRERTLGKDAFKILQFCGVMKRPLTAMEYQEVLGLSPGQTSLDRKKLPNDMNKVIGDCCGLTFIDEEDSTVHYVHHSVKKHLFGTSSRHSEEFNMAGLDWHIGVLCMTYLDFTDFKRQLTKIQDGSNTPIRPVQLGMSPFGSYSSVTGRMALRLLSYREKLQHLSAGELERKAQQILGDKESSRLEMELQSRGFHFLEYARNHWINHLTNPQPDSEDMAWSLFCRCVEGNDIVAYRPWESAQKAYEDRNDVPQTIQWLSAYGHYHLLLYYIRRQPYILTENIKRHILRSSITNGHHRLARCIIQHGRDSPALMNHGLFLVSREGCSELLPSLLQVVTHVDARVCGQTALQAAAQGGHLQVVERLLAATANVNAPAAEGNGRTALQAAAQGGHLKVVERLLAATANVNAPAAEGNGRTALQAAAEGGHLQVVERLLAAKADINAPPGEINGRTALQAAAEGGHLQVVERLLAAKAVVNAPAGYGGTALQAAAYGGHLKVVERLLAVKADVNAPDKHGRTALQAAAHGGHLQVVERLLAAKADVNAPAGYEGTELQVVVRTARTSHRHTVSARSYS
ncbi:hypothetical protein DTO006G1_2214 [Penicillium roqueforti]|nr:hypothetical protein DTO006G1_2214 [Penicillium roqueforti]